MIAAVDWPLLLLVACLFAITGALNQAGIAAQLLEFLDDHELLPNGLASLTLFSVVTSNTIGSLPGDDAAVADLADAAAWRALRAGDCCRPSPAICCCRGASPTC